jgi:hypothetical protein
MIATETPIDTPTAQVDAIYRTIAEMMPGVTWDDPVVCVRKLVHDYKKLESQFQRLVSEIGAERTTELLKTHDEFMKRRGY